MRQFIRIAAGFLLLAATGHTAAQENLVSDPYLELSPSIGASMIDTPDTWVTTIEKPALGKMGRCVSGEIADSVMYCNMHYAKEPIYNELSSFSQRISGIRAKKYILEVWVKFLTPDSYLTIGARYGESSTKSGSAANLTTISSTDGDAIVGQWTRIKLNIDLTDVTDPKTINYFGIYILPQVNNIRAVVSKRNAEMLIMHPRLYAVNDALPYIADGDFEIWKTDPQTSLREPTGWEYSAGAGGCVHQAAGMLDNDQSLEAITTTASGNTYIASDDGALKVPSRKSKLTFYCRATTDGNVTVSLQSIGTVGTIAVTKGLWRRYEVPIEYAAGDKQYPVADKVKFAFTSAGSYRIDGVTIAPTYDSSNPRPVENTYYVTNNHDSGEHSLRDVIGNSQSGDSIVIALDNATITLQSAIDMTDKGVIIEGNGNTIAVEAPGTSDYGIFVCRPTQGKAAYTYHNMTLKPGNTGYQGGSAIYFGDTKNVTPVDITLDSLVITGARASGYGGGVYVNLPMGNTLIKNCKFTDCSTTGDGGALAVRGTTKLIHSSFIGCSATNGAALSALNGAVDATQCTFSYCSTSGTSGGAAINSISSGGLFKISRSAFIHNTSTSATAGCGGLATSYNTSNTVVENCTFYGNSALRGAAISIYNIYRMSGGKTVIANCTFTASTKGAAVNVGGTSSYGDPVAYLANNLWAHNDSSDINLTKGEVKGTNNLYAKLIDNTQSALNGSIVTSDEDFALFAKYENGTPAINTAGLMAINSKGKAKAAGTSSYLVDGENVIPSTDQSGDIRPAAPSVGAYEGTETTGMGNIAQEAGTVGIYPNPAHDQFTVAGDFTTLSLINAGGQTILTTTTHTVNVATIARGIYIARIVGEKGTVNKKIIIK